MRTPRRAFAVEYKTSRRQAKAQPKSIWGNLDLRAMADAFEADGRLPPEDRTGPSVGDIGAPIEPMTEIRERALPEASREINNATPPLVSEPSDEPQDAHHTNVEEAKANSSDQASGVLEPAAPPTVVERVTKAKRSRTPKRPQVENVQEVSIGEPGSEAELAELAAENRSLKWLLVAKLQTENDRLKSLLRRFDRR